jgi:alpha-pyrone synthase
MTNSFLWCIETATPKYCHIKDNIIDFYCNAAGEDEQAKRKIKAVAHRSGINKRYSVINDFSSSPANFSFFPKNELLSPAPSLSQRMQVFKKEALPLAAKSILKIANFESIKKDITHIITVTCTGLFAPGLDIELMELLDLKPTTHRASINFMGCNAAVLALKQAHQICCSEANALVLVVCVELCSIHFQNEFDDDYLMSNQIFGDGAAAVLVGTNPKQLHEKYRSVKLQSFHSLVIHEGRNEMAWQLSEQGFRMNLTSYVSPLINKYMLMLMEDLHLDPAKVKHWAVHPGGRKILDDLCKTMDINPLELRYAYDTLLNYGNMSSPTILFVLENLLQNAPLEPGDHILAAAFGPGLNIETATLQYV